MGSEGIEPSWFTATYAESNGRRALRARPVTSEATSHVLQSLFRSRKRLRENPSASLAETTQDSRQPLSSTTSKGSSLSLEHPYYSTGFAFCQEVRRPINCWMVFHYHNALCALRARVFSPLGTIIYYHNFRKKSTIDIRCLTSK